MRTWLALAVLSFAAPLHAAEAKPVRATVESTLPTAGNQIRQYAFDHDAKSYYASESNPGKDDSFTLTFDAPVTVKSVTVTTGKPEGGDNLTAGELEWSADGKEFKSLAKFADGAAHGTPNKKIKAVRVKPGETKHPLVIREFAVESDPPVATFKYPVEVVPSSEDPEMTAWITKAAKICEHEYDMINEELKSDGYKPMTKFPMALRNNYNGVAATGGGRVNGSVKFFHDHPDDFGAMVHETVHIVQRYRGRGNPGWLVEGVADYVRFFKYEPGKIGRIGQNWKYDGAYRQTAHFLNYVSEKYDKDLVRKLNAAMREGSYQEELWKLYTKKDVKELGAEWKETLKR
jgi:hypothetical protein